MINIKPNNKEKGITLIALLIAIVILVILAAVTFKNFMGDKDFAGVATGATESTNIVSYKEKIEYITRNVILMKAMMGEHVTLKEIVGGLNNETTWIKEAHENIGSNTTNDDIIVTTTDGYKFQIFYDSTYGAVFIEYIGKTDKGEIPNLFAKYEKSIASIITNTSISSGKIEKLELIYRGEIIQTITDLSGELRLKVDESGTGWYIIKVTTDKGKLRYAWIRVNNVTDRLTVPIITASPTVPDGREGWYKTSPISIEIKTDSPSANEIHYILSGATEQVETVVQGKTVNFNIEKSGMTTITAWAEDGKGFQSEIAIKEIKLDNEKPSITHNETSNKDQVGIWYKDNVTVEIQGKDNHSGIAGYSYMVEGQDVNYTNKNMDEKIIVSNEGETRIKAKTIDVAGNESDLRTITIHKDTIPPDTARITFKSNTISSITVEAVGNDNTSGVSGYTFQYREINASSNDWKTLSNGRVTSTQGKVTYTYNIPRGEYSVRVIVTDAAGNDKISDALNTATILNRAPVFTDLGTVASVDRTSMQIRGTATDADGDRLTYTFYWSTSSNLANPQTETKTENAGTAVTFTKKTGLAMNTTYYWRIDVTDGIDTTTGTVRSGKTNANQAPTFSNDGTAESITFSSMTIRARANDGDGDRLTYTLNWGTSSNLGQTATTTGNSGADVTFARTGLSRGTTYYWRIDVSDGITTTRGSLRSGATTANSAPVLNSQSGTVSNITTITVKAKATDGNGDKLTYTLTWSTNSNLSSAQTSTATGNSGAEVTFPAKTGLGNYTTYYWKVTVTDGYGGSASSSVQSTRTWCKTTQCAGPGSGQVKCDVCIENSNTGVISMYKCSGVGNFNR